MTPKIILRPETKPRLANLWLINSSKIFFKPNLCKKLKNHTLLNVQNNFLSFLNSTTSMMQLLR